MGKKREDMPPKDPELAKIWFAMRQRRATLTMLAFGAKKRAERDEAEKRLRGSSRGTGD